jgi:uncharacterized protein DUF6745
MRTAPLSPGELAHIPEFVEKWTEIGHSTEPIDRDWAEGALARFYEFAGLSEPWVVWAPCPLSGMLSASVYAAITLEGRAGHIGDRQDLDRVVDRVARDGRIVPAPHLGYRQMRVIVQRVVRRALRLHVATETGSEPPPLYPLGTAFSAASHAAHYWRFDRALERSLNHRIAVPITAALQSGFHGVLRRVFQQVIEGLEERLHTGAQSYLGAPFCLAHAGQLDYANEVLGLPLDRGFIDLVQHCGLFWVFDGICIAAERPSHINRDEAGQLHCEVGPSIACRSGWSCWHWHGTEVWQSLIEEPQRISAEAIERMPSPGLRRIMIERYRTGEETHGMAAYLRDVGGARLDQDEAFGTLWRRTLPGQEPFLAVEVVNHTAEPDGSYKHHFLRVDPELRPILSDGQLGMPQRLTARNAVASSFGLRGADYEPDIQT